MSYVPPHKRIGGRSAAPSPFPRIKMASSFIGKIHVVSGESCRLHFQVFEGETYGHLLDWQQYVVTAVEDDDPGKGCGTLADGIGIDSVSSDISAASRSLRESSDSSPRRKSKLVLRFGKLVFRDLGHRLESFDPDYLERNISNFKKAFHTAIPAETFNGLERIALREEDIEVDDTERYYISVKDIDHPRQVVKCVCERAHDSIVLKKLKSEPLRHLVCDYLCVGRKMDIRIMVYDTKVLTDIPDDERSAYETLVSAAQVDDAVKGGLRWSLGRDSVANRFRVHSVEHRKMTKVRGKETVWRFVTANRAEGDPSGGRVSYELSIGAIDWKGNEASRLQKMVECAESCI